jgi:hypothetical protein
MLLHMKEGATPSHKRAVYDAWQAQLHRLAARAPTSAAHPVQSADEHWIMMAVLSIVQRTARIVMGCSVAIGAAFVLLSTRSVVVSALSTLTMCCVLLSWLGLAHLSGFLDEGLGMLECLVLIVAVGLMLDPLSHVAFACTPMERR